MRHIQHAHRQHALERENAAAERRKDEQNKVQFKSSKWHRTQKKKKRSWSGIGR